MPELDAFERSLEAAFRDFADRGVIPVDAVEFTERVAGRPRARRWGLSLGPSPRLAWVLVAAALLLVVLLATLLAGGWRPDQRLAVVPPSVSPVPNGITVSEATDILASTKAKPLPAQATCPPGSDPDALGDATQDRPTWGVMAFDRHAGRIVLLEPGSDDGALATRTWTYDVCANAWQQMRPADQPPVFAMPWRAVTRLVYDADSDRTLAFTVSGTGQDGELGEIWSYDLAADRWTKARTFPWLAQGTRNSHTHGTIFYHDPSGLVALFDGTDMWAYDVDTDTMAKVRQAPDPSLPADAGLPQGMTAFGYDQVRDLVVAVVVPYAPPGGTGAHSPWSKPVGSGQGSTWTFDPGTGSWRRTASPAAADLISCGVLFKASQNCFPTAGRAVFDEASGLPLFLDRSVTGFFGEGSQNRIDAYDASSHAWSTLREAADPGAAGPGTCQSSPPVYDPLNRRIVCLGDGAYAGVWAYSTATGESRWLLEPDVTG